LAAVRIEDSNALKPTVEIISKKITQRRTSHKQVDDREVARDHGLRDIGGCPDGSEDEDDDEYENEIGFTPIA
jgi:hypothetical protein